MSDVSSLTKWISKSFLWLYELDEEKQIIVGINFFAFNASNDSDIKHSCIMWLFGKFFRWRSQHIDNYCFRFCIWIKQLETENKPN